MFVFYFLSSEFGESSLSVPLFFKVPDFHYNTVQDRSKEAPMPKPALSA